MDVLVRELYHRLEQLGIKSISGPNVRRLKDSERSLLLYVVIHGAFYPQYFSRDSQASRVDEREAVRSLGGLDPYTSVRLQGFPTDQPAKAYLQQIKEHLLEISKRLTILHAFMKTVSLFANREPYRRNLEPEDQTRRCPSVDSVPARREPL